ncbi:MAG: hypothetical protein A2Z38_02985 [Planctomycetes bacterium RBG_19FT_COMBO_48_8]|nr:MAG: hypothetical protein A2Z38_02985 [Planctomycetes bacterium RBG_19FT_COMBO_48_8]
MSKISVFLILFFISVVPAASGFDAEIIRKTPLLRDGFVMNRVDGNLIGPDGNDVWFFELASDVNDYRTVIKAGTRLELLPSSALEKMTADKKMRTTAAYRLWNSRVTKYKGRNFIFPGFFMPLSKAEKPEPELSKESQLKQQEPARIQSLQERALDEPNDILAMPQEIIEKLRAGRERTVISKKPIADSNEISVDESQPATEIEKLPDDQSYTRSFDSIYVDRTAFLVEQDDGRLIFMPDALGRNVQKLSLHLLPCTAMELTELKKATEPEKVRFKIAGIMTKYKGDNYLLLEKATRTYSHGNFGR